MSKAKTKKTIITKSINKFQKILMNQQFFSFFIILFYTRSQTMTKKNKNIVKCETFYKNTYVRIFILYLLYTY